MPKKRKTKSNLQIVREGIGDSQSEFARRLGVSASIIKKVEAGKRDMSDDLISRVFAETGVMFVREPLPAPISYSKEDFHEWKKELPFTAKVAGPATAQIAKWVEIMLSAAGRPGIHKGYPVFNSLVLALHRIADEFRLQKHIDAELRDRSSAETRLYTVRELRDNDLLANQLGFKDAPKLKDDDTVPLKRSFGWLPGREVFNVMWQHRELFDNLPDDLKTELSEEQQARVEEVRRKLDAEIDRIMIPHPPPPAQS
jgi:transcriptional regulator with XRE-family HTH domain